MAMPLGDGRRDGHIKISVRRPSPASTPLAPSRGALELLMDRLPLLKPRSKRLYCLAVTPVISIGVHWHGRSHICCSDHSDCRYCDLVPRRSVVYAAALVKTSVTDLTPQLGLIERSGPLYNEICRQSGTNWHDTLGRLAWTEEVSGRDRQCIATRTLDDPVMHRAVSIEELAWSVAALYRFPRFPACATIGQAQRALQSFAARVQTLHFSSAKEVI